MNLSDGRVRQQGVHHLGGVGQMLGPADMQSSQTPKGQKAVKWCTTETQAVAPPLQFLRQFDIASQR